MLYTTHPEYLHYIHILSHYITISLVKSQCLMVALRATLCGVTGHKYKVSLGWLIQIIPSNIRYLFSLSYGKWYIYIFTDEPPLKKCDYNSYVNLPEGIKHQWINGFGRPRF